jgi:WD40 repeat protein
VATAGLDRTATVWDVTSDIREPLYRFTHQTVVEGVAFSPDGKRLATAGSDGVVRVFLLDFNELVRVAQSRVRRPWTRDECEQYLHRSPCPPETTLSLKP